MNISLKQSKLSLSQSCEAVKLRRIAYLNFCYGCIVNGLGLGLVLGLGLEGRGLCLEG